MRLNAHITYPIKMEICLGGSQSAAVPIMQGLGPPPVPGWVFVMRIMATTHSAEFRRKASECRRRADEVAGAKDKHAWLKLADDWGKLARGEELKREWLHARQTVLGHRRAQNAGRSARKKSKVEAVRFAIG